MSENTTNQSNPEHERIIFVNLFQIANSLQTFLDQYLKVDNLTAKQFLLMIEIGTFGPEGGLLKDVAERSESSHQNVKQIAMKLEKNGYITITKDPEDKRAKRLTLTEKAMEYWQSRFDEDQRMLSMLFEVVPEDNLGVVAKELIAIKENIKKMGGTI